MQYMRRPDWKIRYALCMSGIQRPTWACTCFCYPVAMTSKKHVGERSVQNLTQRCVYLIL